MLVAQGRAEEAVAACRKGLSSRPDDVALRLALGLAEAPSFPGAAQTVRRILPAGEIPRGFGVLFTGSSIGAMVVPPFATLILRHAGWRAAFLVVTAIFGAATILIAFFVPPHPGDPSRTLRAELKVFRIGQVWLALGVGAIGFGGFFAVSFSQCWYFLLRGGLTTPAMWPEPASMKRTGPL